MRITSPWVGYIDRSYRNAKESLITRFKSVAPEITDFSETNILVILLSSFAGLAEQLHFYIDNLARESYLGTARKLSSVIKLTNILDYRVKASMPAQVDLYFTFLNSSNQPVNITEQAYIPSGTTVRTQNNLMFTTINPVYIPIGSSFGKVSAKQMEWKTDVSLGTTTGLPGQELILETGYSDGSLRISINGEVWTLVDSFARSLPSDKHYTVVVPEDKIPRLKFGTGIKGYLPTANMDIIADYAITQGSVGNYVLSHTITQLVGSLNLPSPATRISITNELAPSGGADVEGLEDIRRNAPLSIRTLDRAVTEQDYKDLTTMAPGVSKANVVYTKGKNLDVYIAPAGGGLANDSLLAETKQYLEQRKMVTTKLTMHAAGITPVVVHASVQAKFRADKIQTRVVVDEALGNMFSFQNQDINGRVAMSDVIAVIDNLSTYVDTVDIIALYTMPYAAPSNHTTSLNWDRQTLIGSNQELKWKLIFAGTNWRLYRGTSLVGTINTNTEFTDPQNIIKFKINPGMYSIGEVWDFITYPYNRTIKVNDNTIPVIIPGDTTIIDVQ